MGSLESVSKRENPNAIFKNGKLEKPDELVDTVKNTTIKDVGYELNTATASDIKFDLASDLNTDTHTRNRIMDQELLSFWTIGEVSFLPLPTKLNIAAI